MTRRSAEKNLGTLAVSGLLVGPVLGSALVLLPPLAMARAGDGAIGAWGVTLVLMGVFAALIGALALRFPGEGGLTEAVGAAFGPRAKALCAELMMAAGCFGPLAALGTGGAYLAPLLPGVLGDPFVASLLLLGLCLAVMLRRVTFVGAVAFWASTLIALVVLCGGIYALIVFPRPDGGTAFVQSLTMGDPAQFGSLVLLLFWAIIGWEIVGNYTGEVDRPERTIPRAVAGAFLAIVAVYVAALGALHFAHLEDRTSLASILEPLFGALAGPLLGVLATLLCATTYIMFLGGIARLLRDRAAQGAAPRWLARRNAAGAPAAAQAFYAAIHGVSFVLHRQGVLSLEGAVSATNAFMILNALVSLLAGAVLFRNLWARGASLGLGVLFFAVFAFSPRWVLLAVILLLLYTAVPPASPDPAKAPRGEEGGPAPSV